MAPKQRYKVHHSTVLDASAEAVWAERIPARYAFTVLPGHDLFQQEVAGRDEVQRVITYRAVARALCVVDYVATHRVHEVTNDPERSYLEWTRGPAPPAGRRISDFPVVLTN